jgi:hypothetical protein
VKSRFRVLDVVLAAAIAVIVVVPTAHADSMNEVVVAHRGAKMSKYAEGTLPAYRFAVRNRADLLDADVRWTKAGPDRDSVGTMIICTTPHSTGSRAVRARSRNGCGLQSAPGVARTSLAGG